MNAHSPVNSASVEWRGVHYKTILSVSETNGAMSVIDCLSPVGDGPPRHIHENEDETFVILSGACEFWLEGHRFIRQPGESAFVARGREHTFRVVGTEPCRHLVILTPGGFERFFQEMSSGHFRIPEDMGQITESAVRHGLRFTGPPLEVD